MFPSLIVLGVLGVFVAVLSAKFYLLVRRPATEFVWIGHIVVLLFLIGVEYFVAMGMVAVLQNCVPNQIPVCPTANIP